MEERRWQARTKRELIIEVWEHLDCESVGASELLAIDSVVRRRFGAGASDPPAMIARVLADEGAELRHPEVLELDVQVRSTDSYGTTLREIVKLTSLANAAASISKLDELRREYERNNDREGLRRIRETAQRARRRMQMISRDTTVDAQRRAEKGEISEWLRVWLQQPAVFHDWLDLRRRSRDFQKSFGDAASA